MGNVATNMFGDFAGNALTSSKGSLKGANNKLDLRKTNAFMNGVGTALNVFNAADQLIGGIVDIIPGFGTDNVSLSAADRAGFKGKLQAQNFLNKSGVGRLFTAVAGERMQKFNESAYMNTVGTGFTGSANDFGAAADLGGKKIAFGKKEAKSFLDTANAQSAMVSQIGYESELAKANSAGQLYQQQNFNKYQGHRPTLLMKKGSKFPELEKAKTLLLKLNLNGKEVFKFQLGGKIIDPSKNIIPDGALHKNRNHLSEHNEELQDQITEKGIPVVSEDKEGNIIQHAEVEVGEVIFNLANTEIIEGYWKQYQETGDESIAIECGKFLTKELLHNTVDKAGIKNTVE